MGLLGLLESLTTDERVERVVQVFAQQAIGDWNTLREGKAVSESENHALDVYVEPNISIRVEEGESTDSSERLRQEERDEVPSTTPPGFERLSGGFDELIANHILGGSGRVVLYEDAGAGKTVFTWRLREALSRLATPCLALRFEKKWKTNIEQHLIDLLTDAYKADRCDAAEVVQKLLKERRVVLIFDAADQQAEDFLRLQFHDAISHDSHPRLAAQLRIVVTSRAFRVRDQEQHLFHAAHWRHACVELFDKELQGKYKRQLRTEVVARWNHLIPDEERFADQLRFPEVLKMIREIAEDPVTAKRESFHRRADLYLAVAERRLKRAFKGFDAPSSNSLVPKLKKTLGCFAFEMMLKTRDQYGYAAPGDLAESVRLGALVRFERIYPSTSPTIVAQIQRDWGACEEILKNTELTDRSILENNETGHLSFRSLKMLEFFAGWYLANFTSEEDLRILLPQVGKASWYWPWRFATELASSSAAVQPFSANHLSRALSALFLPPSADLLRPTELIYRAYELFQKTQNRDLQVNGQKILAGFQMQFTQVLTDPKNPQAHIAAQLVPSHRLATMVDSGLLTANRLDELRDAQQPLDPSRSWLSLEETFVRCPNTGEGPQHYSMGSPENIDGVEPAHDVALDPFWMAATQVTRNQYALFDPNHEVWSEKQQKELRNKDNRCPVINVTWYSAFIFAIFTGNKLPTEAQWEYACRAGSTGKFCLAEVKGEVVPIKESTLDLVAFWNKGINDGPQEVAKLEPKIWPNSWGLFDMHGNVWEWVSDWYDPKFYETDEAKKQNPGGPITGSSRVFRGGSFLGGLPINLQCAYRFGYEPAYFNHAIGFRLCGMSIVSPQTS